METTYLIIGAGIAGLTLAIGLQDRNIPFLICESATFIKGIGAGFGLASNAMKAFEYINLSHDVASIGNPLNALNILDPNGKPIIIGRPNEVSKDAVENYALHRADLHEMLLSKINSNFILTSHKLVRLELKEHIAIFEGGQRINYKIIVGADGIHSSVRQIILPQSRLRYSGYTCWRAVINNSSNNIFESFETWGKLGRFGITPLTKNRIYWYACINAPLKDAVIRNFSIGDLRAQFKTYHKQIQSVLALTEQHHLIRHDLYDLTPIQQYAFGSVILIGDAAHATTPNLGQGACIAVEDVAVFLKLIDLGYKGEKFNNLFNRLRVPRCQKIVSKSKLLGSIAQLDNQILIDLRNVIFRNLPKFINHKEMRSILNFDINLIH